ncbi:hypothetical protein B216_05545, partial [Bifidobacterium bifidum LMG 13195]
GPQPVRHRPPRTITPASKHNNQWPQKLRIFNYDQRTGSDSHEWLLLCILMLLYIVKRLDPLFEFGQVPCSAFDFVDAA